MVGRPSKPYKGAEAKGEAHVVEAPPPLPYIKRGDPLSSFIPLAHCLSLPHAWFPSFGASTQGWRSPPYARSLSIGLSARIIFFRCFARPEPGGRHLHHTHGELWRCSQL
jgi:hypothetical protein